jgi:hypothetical protein
MNTLTNLAVLRHNRDMTTTKDIARVQIVDTRAIDWATGKRLTGTGRKHACDLCAKSHEVHVIVTTINGDTLTVGSSCYQRAFIDVPGGGGALQVLNRAKKALAAEVFAARAAA